MKWYQANPERFEMEKRLLRFHKGVKLVIKDGKMHVVMQLQTARDTYLIEGIFPKKYPYAPLEVYVRQPNLKSPPHLYRDGRLCLHDIGDTGPQTTAKVYMDWTKQWVTAYEKWLDGKSWPKTNKR